MFLNDNQNFYVYLYWGKCPLGEIRPPPPLKSLPPKILIFFNFFFHFRCILLQISHKKCFFISISILGRSGVIRESLFLTIATYMCFPIHFHRLT